MIETKVDSEWRLIVTEMNGVLCDAEFQAAREQWRHSPALPPGFRQLIDLTGVTQFDLTASAAANLAGGGSVIGPGVKRAIVAPDNLPFGIARMFATFAEGHGQTMHVFRSRAEAMAWLGTEPR